MFCFFWRPGLNAAYHAGVGIFRVLRLAKDVVSTIATLGADADHLLADLWSFGEDFRSFAADLSRPFRSSPLATHTYVTEENVSHGTTVLGPRILSRPQWTTLSTTYHEVFGIVTSFETQRSGITVSVDEAVHTYHEGATPLLLTPTANLTQARERIEARLALIRRFETVVESWMGVKRLPGAHTSRMRCLDNLRQAVLQERIELERLLEAMAPPR